MTLREIIYMIMDEIKLMSDDSSFNEDHIKFLIGKYRAFLLNQAYSKGVHSMIPISNYQTIPIQLKQIKAIEELDNSKTYLISVEELPALTNISSNKVSIKDIGNYRISFISRDRFKYIGFNKWHKNIIYCTIIDNYLYLKSSNNLYSYLEEIYFTGIFEDVEKAFNMDPKYKDTDILDLEYPIEAILVPALIQSVVNELLPKTALYEDTLNNAKDDKASMNTMATKAQNS